MIKWLLTLFIGLTSHLNGVAPMRLTSPAFDNNTLMPAKYTCTAENISPPLHLEGVPKETKSLVLIVEDPDALNQVITHWVVFNIPSITTNWAENSVPAHSMQGANHKGLNAYTGPCPPQGIHRYFFRLFALDTPIPLAPGASKEEVQKEMKTHVIKEAQLIGLYRK